MGARPHYPNGYFLSKSNITIQNGLVFAGLDFLKFYGFDILEAGKEIQIGYSGKILLIDTTADKAWLYIGNTKVSFLLGASIKKDEYQWVIPLNSILDLFGKPLKVIDTTVYFN